MRTAGIPQKDVPRVYRQVAPVYDIWAALTESRARRISLREAAVKDGESVLEVAVGTGIVFEKLAAANTSGFTDGIDLTEAMLDRARAKVAGLAGRHRLRVGDAHDIDAPDATYDLLVNNYMFDLLPEEDFPGILDEFRRVLVPGARLLLVNMAIAEHVGNRIWDLLYRINPALLGGCRGVDLAPFVTRAGFANVRRLSVSQWTFPSEIITATRS